MPKTETATLTLICQNKPLLINNNSNVISNKGNSALSNFSYYDGDDPNKFYTEIKSVKDIMPKDEEFLRIGFRLLSATIVGANSWKTTDFTNEDILKAAKDKLVGKSIFKEHDQDVANWVGIIESVKWSDAKTQDGVSVPAGIDGILKIDCKTNPKLARGLLIGAIYSNSVTVSFDWMPSHPNPENDSYYFMDHLGEVGPDGKLIRRIVTKINDFYETSIVWMGADPYAKIIGQDGKLLNIDTHNTVQYNKESEEVKYYNSKNKYFLFTNVNEYTLSLSKNNIDNIDNNKNLNNNKNKNMQELLNHFSSLLGYDANALKSLMGLKPEEEITKENLISFLKKDNKNTMSDSDKSKLEFLNKFLGLEFVKSFIGTETDLSKINFTDVKFIKNEEFKSLSEKLLNLEKEKLEWDKKVIALEAKAKIGTDYVDAKKSEIVRLYKLNAGANSDEAVINLIKNADYAALDGLLKQYVDGATLKFSGRCKKCNSTEFEFKSTLDATNTITDNSTNETSVPNLQDVYNKYAKKNFN